MTQPKAGNHHRPLILAAFDVSPEWTFVVERAVVEARALGADLHLVHAVLLPAAEAGYPGMLGAVGTASSIVTDLVATGKAHLASAVRHAASLGGAPSGHIVVGDPLHEIVALAKELDADRLIVGTHDRGAVARLLLGSVAHELARAAPCEVLIVRPKLSASAPEILPPCPDCLVARSTSGDDTAWCERHRVKHPHAHTYSDTPEGYGEGSQTFRGE